LNFGPHELQLMILAIGFYLYDSSLLLYSDEAVLTSAGDRWSATLPNGRFLLRGRTLLILNPFFPHRPAFRLSGDRQRPGNGGAVTGWSGIPVLLRPLTPAVLTAGVALFLLLPLGLFSALGVWTVVVAVILLYGSLFVALTMLFRRRREFDLRGRRFAGFAFECIACPPFGVNMIRRFALATTVAEPFTAAAHRLLDAAALHAINGAHEP
jgi:hypothetical protein